MRPLLYEEWGTNVILAGSVGPDDFDEVGAQANHVLAGELRDPPGYLRPDRASLLPRRRGTRVRSCSRSQGRPRTLISFAPCSPRRCGSPSVRSMLSLRVRGDRSASSSSDTRKRFSSACSPACSSVRSSGPRIEGSRCSPQAASRSIASRSPLTTTAACAHCAIARSPTTAPLHPATAGGWVSSMRSPSPRGTRSSTAASTMRSSRRTRAPGSA